MLAIHHVEVGRETVRRWLRRGDLVYRRPRPTLGPKGPDRQTRLDALRALLAALPADETAVVQDEVAINTDPKIGSMGMAGGQQATVETPGNNEERYLSGSIHWRTGQVFLTEGQPKQGRDTALFLAPLDDLRSRRRCYKGLEISYPSGTPAGISTNHFWFIRILRAPVSKRADMVIPGLSQNGLPFR